jgi:hypothetical protein
MPDDKLEPGNYLHSAQMFEPGRLVMDPAMLRLLPRDKIRDIAVIAMRAHLAAMESQLKAQQEIIRALETVKL